MVVSCRRLLNISRQWQIHALDETDIMGGRECSKKHALSLSEGSVQQGRSHFDARSVHQVRERERREERHVCEPEGQAKWRERHWRLFSTFPKTSLAHTLFRATLLLFPSLAAEQRSVPTRCYSHPFPMKILGLLDLPNLGDEAHQVYKNGLVVWTNLGYLSAIAHIDWAPRHRVHSPDAYYSLQRFPL